MKGRTERQVRHWFYILILAPVAMGKEDLSKAKGPPGRERANWGERELFVTLGPCKREAPETHDLDWANCKHEIREKMG